ncbi:hypothetical protein KKG36_03260 [Patescibacteria group bacterium]|nr:hypothetical protein [Patescibacteria group bacterium]
MGVKLILTILCLVTVLFIVSCTSEPEIELSMPAIYIVDGVEESQSKTFVVGEEGNLAWYDETKQQRYEQNMRRSLDEYMGEQEEFEIKSKLSNVRRAVDDEVLFGFDEELDNSRWEEVDD